MKLSIVILNWNAAEDTIQCVQPIAQWAQLKPTVWVVDNASASDDAAQIEEALPAVKLIRSLRNEGFAGGTNLGIEAALQSDDAPILLLNNDARITEDDALTLLNTLAQDDSAGIVGPLLFDEEEGFVSAGGKNPVWHFQTRGKSYRQGLNRVNNVSGTAVVIRPEVFRDAGFLDEEFFFSTEMADFCARARYYDWQSVVNSQAKAYHSVSRSARYRNSLYVYYIVRNRFLYIRKYYHYLPRLALETFWAGYSLALTTKLKRDGATATASAVRLGLKDGLAGRFGGQNERVLAACQSN